MKVQFSAVPETTVTLWRGADSVQFSLRALPLGYTTTYLDTVFPRPVVYENSVPVPVEDNREYWDLYQFLLLARGLQHSGVLETPVPTSKERAAWEAYAKAVRQEFSAANFSNGEVSLLMEELGKLNRAQTAPEQKRAVGNG